MNALLRKAFEDEMEAGRNALAGGRYDAAFACFERAHILGQRFVIPHTRSHLAMLAAGWRIGDWREVAGQLPRILASLVFSRIWVPLGNTGRARVSAFRPMPVPDDLARLLDTDH